jgi:hypothetical protein
MIFTWRCLSRNFRKLKNRAYIWNYIVFWIKCFIMTLSFELGRVWSVFLLSTCLLLNIVLFELRFIRRLTFKGYSFLILKCDWIKSITFTSKFFFITSLVLFIIIMFILRLSFKFGLIRFILKSFSWLHFYFIYQILTFIRTLSFKRNSFMVVKFIRHCWFLSWCK